MLQFPQGRLPQAAIRIRGRGVPEADMRVWWVKRNRPIAPVPYIHTEAGLPIGQKALVFLPHSDDGRYIGCSLSLMNRLTGPGQRPSNDMRIIVVASGYRSVE